MDCEEMKLLFAGIGLITGSLGAYLIQSGFKAAYFRRDTEKVYQFLKNNSTRFEFRTTKAIANATNIPRPRVVEICMKDERIRESEGDKDEIWILRH